MTIANAAVTTLCLGCGVIFQNSGSTTKITALSISTRKCNGCLLVLYFVGQATGGQGAFQNLQNRQNRHEGYRP